MTEKTGSITIAAALLLAGVSTVLASLTIERNREYRSGVMLAAVTVDRHPTPSAQHVLAENLLQAGRRDEAMRLLWSAVPGAPRAHYTLGIELFKEGRLDEAIEQLEAFVDRQPRLVWVVAAYGVLGQAHEARGDWPAAIEAFQRASILSPGNPATERALADVLLAGGRVNEAILHYRRLVNRDARDAAAMSQLGIALGSADRLDEAIEQFRKAATVDPSLGSVQHNLALALCRQGDMAGALVHARNAVALQPGNAESQSFLEQLRILEQQGSSASCVIG